MMVEPHESTLEHATLRLITDWLAAVPPPQVVLLDDCQKESFSPVEAVVDKVREVCCSFGPEQSLFGILAEPIEISPQNSRSETVILMLNVGANHRIGPNRLYVQMARSWAASGYRAFRFDLTGIGDSFAKEGFFNKNLYEKDSTADVRFAIDCLVAKGCKKIVLTGICSGAFVAFQTALVDPRVTVQILMNPRLLEYQVEKEKGTLQSAMQSYYKSTHFYQRELLNPKVYRRLLRGEVDVNGIAKRFQIVFKARLKRVFNALLKSAPDDLSVLAQVKQLSARGTDTLLIMATQDDGRDYIDIQLGTQCSYMQGRPNFGMVLVENADHTFSNSKSQQFVIAAVHQHLEKFLTSEGLTVAAPAAKAALLATLTSMGASISQ